MQLLNVGFGNTVVANRIVAVVKTGSSPARKLKEIAKNSGKLVDVTEGRRTRSIIVLDSEHIILSSVQTETLGQRMLALQSGHQLSELVSAQRIRKQEKS